MRFIHFHSAGKNSLAFIKCKVTISNWLIGNNKKNYSGLMKDRTGIYLILSP